MTTTMSTESHLWFQSVVITTQFILLLAVIIAMFYATNKLWYFLAKVIDLLDKINTKQELIGRSDVKSVDTIDKKNHKMDKSKAKTSTIGSVGGSHPNNTDDYVAIDLDQQSVTINLWSTQPSDHISDKTRVRLSPVVSNDNE